MAVTRWTILFISFIVSCVSFALYIVSISTANWVEGFANFKELDASEVVHYGLFSGSATRQVLAARTKYDLTVVCDFSKSACVYSCQDDPETRKTDLNNILNGEDLMVCPSHPQPRIAKRSAVNFPARDEEMFEDLRDKYIPAGYWLCTVLFLSIAISFTAASSVFSLINMIYSPIQPVFNIFGLYIWNSIAAGAALLSLILWAVVFRKHIINNIAVTDTLNSNVTFVSKGNASVGFSYYIMLAAFMVNLINIGLLVLRIYLVNRSAKPPTITIDKDDAPLEFY